MTENETEEEGLQDSGERLQDFLMPGLRHAHTLQQLRVMNTLLFLSDVFIVVTVNLYIQQILLITVL